MKKSLLSLILFLPIVLIGQDLNQKLSSEEKIFGLSQIWSEVNNNFVFLDRIDFDFDSLYMATIPKVIATKNKFEYMGVLSKFMNRLNDGHTSIRFTQEYWNTGDYPPVFLERVDDKFLVKSIAKEYSSLIPLGSELVRAEGAPYAEYKQTSPSGNLFGYVQSTVLLEFKTPSGDIIEKAFIRNFNHQFRTGKSIEMEKKTRRSTNNQSGPYAYTNHKGYAVVTINTFQKDTVVQQFATDISKINSTKGLIIDVRQNGGGNSKYAKGIAKHLVERDYMVGPLWKTRINNGAKKAWGSMSLMGIDNEWTKSNAQYWQNNAWEINSPDTTYIDSNTSKVTVPIVILTGERTFSAAEDFLIYTLGNDNITKIGQHSAGSSGQPLALELPGGIKARICAKRDALPNGEDYIGIGIKPDVEIDTNTDHIQYAISYFNRR